MYDSYLKDAGLSEEQSKVYSYLLKSGPRQAGQISIGTGLSRTFVYKVLEQLNEMSLVDILGDNGVNKYSATHPSNIIELIDKRIIESEHTKSSLQSVVGDMISDYNLYSNKPNVRFFEGKDGLRFLYDDIISTKKDICLFRSPLDIKFSLEDMVLKQIEKQVMNGINTKALTPNVFDDSILNDDLTLPTDKERLTARRMLPVKKFNLPAQIILYGDKIGVTSYRKGIYTSIIENKDLRETFSQLFDYIWEKGKEDHNQLIEERKQRLKKTP